MTDWSQYHLRYSVSGTGRNAATCSHIVGPSLKTLCGRNAADYFVAENIPLDRVECLKCERAKQRRETTPEHVLESEAKSQGRIRV